MRAALQMLLTGESDNKIMTRGVEKFNGTLNKPGHFMLIASFDTIKDNNRLNGLASQSVKPQ
jgi:hypothetical protein